MLSLMLLTVAGILLLGAPAVHADPAVTFADDQPLVVDLTSCPCSLDVLVVNSATHGGPVSVTLTVAGLAEYLKASSTPTAVQRGGPKPIKVRVTTGAVASTGTLILTAGDGSLDREPVHLVGELPPAPARLPERCGLARLTR